VRIPGSASRATSPAGDQLDVETRSSVNSRLRYVAMCALAGAVVGLPAGWLWATLARPPAGVLTATGVVFGETELNAQVEVTMWFLLTGVAVGLLAGVVLAWRSSPHGVTAVLAVLVACCLAGLVSYWAGVHVFGPDASAQLASAEVGQRITAPVSVDTLVAFLGWPVGGLTGALTAISRWPNARESRSVTPVTSNVGTH
jgi:hypothetical protein